MPLLLRLNNMEERTDLSLFSEKISEIKESISKVIVGQTDSIDMLLTAIIADGHVLLEGVPGVAKTLLAKLTARLIDAKFSRIQFTPDLMPSDVLGTSVFNMKTSEFSFHPGPVFANIVLADEINRSPAKTQAALFEVMEERQATIDGTTYPMGNVFTIIATQNPIEQEGTYRLPEAQLDRFVMKISMGYPTAEEEVEILERHNGMTPIEDLKEKRPVISMEELSEMRRLVGKVVMEKSLLKYIADIVQLTRSSKALFVGASPRASIAIMQCAKGYALLQGRDFVVPDDIKHVAPYVLQHRITLTAEAEMEGFTAERVARAIIDKVEVPK